ncbi:7-cyano-7-deazaguanine synthase [Candidatus Woesearchaeota archaeon]|nr:7-cyano-7-deazaguanine synthase [Candidatus Woesearchaeota archaeon]
MRIAVLYSGGVDSTYLAARLAEDPEVKEIHLLTIQNGYSITSFAKKNIQILTKNPKISHHTLNVKKEWHELQRWNLRYKKSRSIKKMCLGCRLLMNKAAAEYCNHNNIKYATEGINKEQSYNPDQGKDFVTAVNYIYREVGIKPIEFKVLYHNKTLKEKTKYLKQHGYNLNGFIRLPGTRGVFLFNQSFCVIGNLMYPFWYFGRIDHKKYLEDAAKKLTKNTKRLEINEKN